jgi:hypothetical protein
MKRLEQQLDSTTNTGGMAKSGSRFSFKRPVRTPGNTSAAKEDGLATINTPGGSDIRSDQYLANATSTAVQREHEATKPSIKSSETNSSTDSADSLNFHNRSHEYITLPPAVSQNSDTKPHDKLSSGTEISLFSLSDCVVNLTAARTQIGVIRAFHVRDLRRCIIVMPYVEGSALIHSCEDCIIAVGCHQVSDIPEYPSVSKRYIDVFLVPNPWFYSYRRVYIRHFHAHIGELFGDAIRAV